MGLFSTIGTIAGGLLGGGPAGAAIGGALGGLIEGSSTERAAQAAAAQTGAATNEAIALQRRMYEEGVARQQPWLQAGQNALAKLQTAAEYTPFGMTQFQADPGYAFRLAEGQKALERSAAARGGLLSGATGKALARYGQEMGSQEYMNAFNRYQAERQARLGPLQSLAGVGQTSAQNLGMMGGTYGANVGNALINQGYTAGQAGLAGAAARQSMYGNIGSALGQITPGQWSSMGSSISNYLNPSPAYGSINPASGEYIGSLEF